MYNNAKTYEEDTPRKFTAASNVERHRHIEVLAEIHGTLGVCESMANCIMEKIQGAIPQNPSEDKMTGSSIEDVARAIREKVQGLEKLLHSIHDRL